MINDVTLVSPSLGIHHKEPGTSDAGLAPRKEAVVSKQKLDKAREEAEEGRAGTKFKTALRRCELVPVDNQIQAFFSSIDLHSTT